MIIKTDIFSAVASIMPKLRDSCATCSMRHTTAANKMIYTSVDQVGYGDCTLCMGMGWIATKNLHQIIHNIEYPFTLVLQNDMIGWMAEIQLSDKDSPNSDRPVYDNPVEAVYAALYRTLIDSKPKRRTRGGGRLINQSVRTYGDSTNGN